MASTLPTKPSASSRATRAAKKRNQHHDFKKRHKQSRTPKIKAIEDSKLLENRLARQQIEHKCIEYFGSKKKSNKFIKQALLKGNQIRTKSNHLRLFYDGYQLLLHNHDVNVNKKLGMKALIDIERDRHGMKRTATADADIGTATAAGGYPGQYAATYQYSADDEILILGEMDFSYALDIAYKLGGAKVTATAYYAEQKCKAKTRENIDMFHRLEGQRVLFGVDATNLVLGDKGRDRDEDQGNMGKGKQPPAQFDKILFGFPRNSQCPNSQKHNVAFMRSVFAQVRPYLKRGGQFQLLLHINKAGHSPLEHWCMDYPEWTLTHEQIFTAENMKKMFPFYQSHDGRNKVWTPYRSGLYVFTLK